MIKWRAIRGTSNPVEVKDLNTGKILLRVYDWSKPDYPVSNSELDRYRLKRNLKKAGLIILAIKQLEANGYKKG